MVRTQMDAISSSLGAEEDPPISYFRNYSELLSTTLDQFDWAPVEQLSRNLMECWKTGKQLFLAGNGGSAGSANHFANDFLYPISKIKGSGIRVHSLSSNPAMLTCLANDEGYENIFSYQLAVLGKPDDVLLVFSGSGNSPNILNVLEEAKRLKMKSYAVLGYSGGKAKELADVPIHFAVEDMQIAEDTQSIVCHMIVQWLYAHRDSINS